MKLNPYLDFGKYLLRTPLLPVNFFLKLTKDKTVTDKQLLDNFGNKIIKEAIFCASPSLFNNLERWEKGTLKDKKKIDRVKLSFFKYLTRLSTRCTPFGLFAGSSVGEFGEYTNIELKEIADFKRYSRIEHEILIKISKKLFGVNEIREKLIFSPNNSIYKVGDEVRYVETNFNETPRGHKITTVKRNYLLEEVLNFSEKGVQIGELINFISNDEIDKNSAEGYVNNLIKNQILVSELEPNNIGIEYFDRVLSILEKIKFEDQNLLLLREKMKLIDSKIGNKISLYLELYNLLPKSLNHPPSQVVIRTDLFLTTGSNIISKKVVEDIKKGHDFLNKLSLNKSSNIFPAFIKAFEARYGERKVALAKVLDTEMGIGFLQDSKEEGIAQLVDDIVLPGVKQRSLKREIVYRGDILLIEKSKNKKPGDVIKLKDDDLAIRDENWRDYKLDWKLSDTIISAVQVITERGETKYIMNGAWGPSGAAWISRFGCGDNKIDELVNRIANFEQDVMNKEDVIIAEVSYFPKSNLSGVMIRKDFRNFEIPYLTHSNKSKENQINIGDLFVYVENGVLKIWSNRLNKRIIPRVTDAHSFGYGSLPFYHFLCEIQFQGKRIGCSFMWNSILDEVSFLPRVEYKNIIFRLAIWRIRKVEIIDFINEKNEKLLIEKMKKWRKKRGIPSFVVFAHGDQELLINFNNYTSIKAFFSSIQKNNIFVLTEFLFKEEGIVKRGIEYFINELIIPLYNSSKN